MFLVLKALKQKGSFIERHLAYLPFRAEPFRVFDGRITRTTPPSGNTPLLRARVTKWRASFILASSKGRKARPGRGKSGYNYNPRCPLMQLHKDISRLGVSSTNRHPLLHSPDISARDYYFGSLLTTVRKRLLHYVSPDRFRHQSDMFTAIE